MALGASRNQLIVLAVLVVIALFSFSYLFSGGSTSTTPATTTTGAASAAKATTGNMRAARRSVQRNTLLPPNLDPALRHDLLALGETYQYDGSKRNIFESRRIEIPPVVDPGKVVRKDPPVPPQPQGPPPIPLKFYGFTTQPGQPKRVFLASTTGDDVFVGTEGQVINKRYRIVKVNNTSVEIEDILNNNKQTIPLTSPS